MNKIYSGSPDKWYQSQTIPLHTIKKLLICALLFLGGAVHAQTINTVTSGTNYTGANGAGANAAVTFVIENTSGAGILLTGIKNWYPAGNAGNVDLYYSATSLSGPYGTLTAAPWTLVASGTQTAPAVGVQTINWTGGLSFLIPSGAQYRFALYSTSYCSYSGATPVPSPSTFTTAGVTLKVGDVQIAGQNVGYGFTNNPRWFTGEITWIPATPCSGPPTVGTITATPTTPCYGQSNVLNLTGTPVAAGLTYQWEQNPGTGWTPIAGATTMQYTVPSVTTAVQYRIWVKCSADSTASAPITLGATPSPLNYSEDFESITVANQLPNCMTATNFPNNTKTYIANQASATNHTVGGSKFGAFYFTPAGTNAFFTPAFNLTAGRTYLFRFWYRGAANANTYNAFGAYYGTSNTVAAMTNFIGSATPTNTTYQEFAETFTPSTTGVYFVGIVGTHTATLANQYVSIDDLGLDELLPCTGTPNPGTITTATPCPNASFTLNRVGGTSVTSAAGLTLQWQDSSALNTWAPSPGVNNQNTYTGTVTVPTKFRLQIACANSAQAALSPAVMVNVAPFINCYCVPTYAIGATTSAITNVKLNTLNNTSTAAAPWYTNYAPQQPGTIAIPNLTMGIGDTLKVTHGTWTVNYSGVWVDFDHNGVFDASEYFTEGTTVGANGIANIIITTPSTALTGLTRMRIRAGDRSPLTAAMACGPTASGYGEAEDYYVNVRYPICNGPTNAGVARATDTAICTGYTIDVYNTTHEYQRSEIRWTWESSTDGGFSWTQIPGSLNQDTIRNLLITGPVQYRLKMYCDATGDSVGSVPAIIRIKVPYECYCYSQSEGNKNDTADIGSVVIHTMVNTTVGPHLGNPSAIRRRTDYTYIPNIELEANRTYRLSIFHTQPNMLHEDALVSVFMDFNNNLTYDINAAPSKELVFQMRTTAAHFYIDTFITIPDAVIPNVPTGMRVILNHDRNPLSPANMGCGPYVSGETEDYVVRFKRIPTTVNNVNGLQRISLFPNPTDGKFTITADAKNAMGTVNVSVSTVTGQVVTTRSYSAVGSSFTEQFDLPGIATGMYFVELRTANGDKMVQKLIVR